MSIQLPFDPSSVPAACTLPSPEQPLRVAEFDELFALVIDHRRPQPTQLDLTLPAVPAVAARVADLAVRETQCCSFYTFTLSVRSPELRLIVEAPPAQSGVLDTLSARAAAASG